MEEDHIIKQGDDFYAGTDYADTWCLCHDALSAWWTPEARAYMASRGFGPERLLVAQSGTNDGTRYAEKLVGNSPELMPLDNNLFADLMFGVRQHVALTHSLAPGDPKKFSTGTPQECWSTLIRTWQVAPSQKRIVQDIQRWPEALNAIIAAEGAVVHDRTERHGRRAKHFKHHPDCDDVVAAKKEMLKRIYGGHCLARPE